MNNNDILELAAKASDLVIESYTENGYPWVYSRFEKANDDGEFNCVKWNPIENDGDALRLAAKLGTSIDFAKWTQTVFYGTNKFVQEDWHQSRDACAATRLAIVRAAAEIGKSMK